jgi:Holliday junction resolvase RusA-like endonuclease
MKLNIEIPFKALSQNNIERSASVNHRYKTREAVLFSKAVFCELSKHQGVKPFFEEFNPDVHGIISEYIFFFNHTDILTKKTKSGRRLSARVGDVSNSVKFLEDCVFKAIGIDDRFVVDVHCHKRPTMARGHILVKLELIQLNCIKDFSDYLTK